MIYDIFCNLAHETKRAQNNLWSTRPAGVGAIGRWIESKHMIERAQIILGCLAGKRVKEVACVCYTRPNTVIKWRQRFVQHGLAGLWDPPRPGDQAVYGVDFRNRVLALLETPSSSGQACWDGPAVAAALKGSVYAVWRVLRHEGLCL